MKNRSWKLAGAQKLADEFPYTFHKPSKEVVSQLKAENQAKLIFEYESDDPEAPSAERMWVEITEVKNGVFSGYLDNEPAYINDLKHKDPIEFRECHIIDTDINDPVPSITDKYIKRCFVTNSRLATYTEKSLIMTKTVAGDSPQALRLTNIWMTQIICLVFRLVQSFVKMIIAYRYLSVRKALPS